MCEYSIFIRVYVRGYYEYEHLCPCLSGYCKFIPRVYLYEYIVSQCLHMCVCMQGRTELCSSQTNDGKRFWEEFLVELPLLFGGINCPIPRISMVCF